MKKMKFLKILLAGVLSAILAFGACACSLFGPETPGADTDPDGGAEIRAIYDLYVESCAEDGETPLTYDEWLASIKGEPGKDGTPGKDGDPGAPGKDGNGWLYGDTVPAASLGRVGDLYLNYSTWDVYTKETTGWTLRGNIKGAKGDKGDPGTGSTTDPTAPGTDDAPELEIHFLELGNGNAGDCTLLKTGNTEVLIDAGSKRGSAKTLVPKIKTYCTDGVLEYVIATHAHEDHIASFVGNNGTDGIFANFKCEIIIDFARSTASSQIYQDYVTWRDKEVSQDGAVHYTALQCWNNEGGAQRSYELAEGISFEILYQKYYSQRASSGENNYSVCTLFTQGDYHYLFTGDLEKAGEESLVASNELPHCKLFKGGHHGSATSSNDVLLNEITPENVCICCCAGSNEYSDGDGTFPTQVTINRLAKHTKNIYVTTLSVDGTTANFTSMNGDITVRSNGVDFSIHGSNNDTILKDTDWFKKNRTWPADGVK